MRVVRVGADHRVGALVFEPMGSGPCPCGRSCGVKAATARLDLILGDDASTDLAGSHSLATTAARHLRNSEGNGAFLNAAAIPCGEIRVEFPEQRQIWIRIGAPSTRDRTRFVPCFDRLPAMTSRLLPVSERANRIGEPDSRMIHDFRKFCDSSQYPAGPEQCFASDVRRMRVSHHR